MHIILLGVFIMVGAFGVSKKCPANNFTEAEKVRIQLNMALDSRRYSKMMRFQGSTAVRGNAVKGLKIAPWATHYSNNRIGLN
jgi:hypothetical protein